MPVVSRGDLENAQRDIQDLGLVLNGAADLPNPGHAVGTIQTRLGLTVKTISKVVADGQAVVESLLTPLTYNTFAEMTLAIDAKTANVYNVKLGQTCYCRETTQIYLATSTTNPTTQVVTRTWEQLSDLSMAATASDSDLLIRNNPVGRISVNDFTFLSRMDRFLEKDALRNQHIRWPGKATINEGLAKALNFTTWPATFGQEGVDFGVPTAMLTTLKAGSAHPAWSAPNRILLKPDSAEKSVIGYNVTAGLINVNNLVAYDVLIWNSIIDGNYAILTAIQPDGILCNVHVKNCIIRKFQAQGATLQKGTISNCLIEGSQGDGLKGDALYGLVLYNNLIRLLGQDLPTAHADGLQIQNANDIQIYGNTIYMPGTGTTYDEGTYGSTQILRIVTESNTFSIKNVVAAGNLLIGGGYALAIRSRFVGASSEVSNIIVANNVFGGPTYSKFGDITAEHGISTGSVGKIENVLLHNNIRLDGTPITYNEVNQNGLWHYNKATASQRFMDLAKRWGYVDWNGDLRPGVVSRTEVNQTPGVIP